MKVVVIGAGKAGTEAAREAARAGASVTLVDSLDTRLPDWQSWPGFIRGGRGTLASDARPPPPGVTQAFGARIVSIAHGSATAAGGRSFNADAFVVATGPGFEHLPLEGRRKAGVSVLDSPEGYGGLGRDMASAERVVVSGEGARGLQVAEAVAAGGRRVTLFVSSWQHRRPSSLAAEVLFAAAGRRGVAVRQGRVDRALGARRLEAVLDQGEVVPCDALAMVPRRVPRGIPGQVAEGRHGGARVGLDMRTSAPGVFSAGGCAELAEGLPPHATLEDEQGPSGRVAGANATGSTVRISASRRASCSVFGLEWVCIGADVPAARAAGLDAVAFGMRGDETSSCTLVYTRASGTVLGLEVVGGQSRSEPAIPRMGLPATLRSLAYDDQLGSSDISMVSETARLGLEAWSKS